MKSPFNNVDLSWEPRLSYILAGLDICDCEEGVRESIRIYNPNRSQDRLTIIKVFVLPGLDYLPYRHRSALFNLLEVTLANKEFDFSTQFEIDYDEYSATAWDETEIEDPRGFFEEIYKLAGERWKEDLQKASLEDQSTW